MPTGEQGDRLFERPDSLRRSGEFKLPTEQEAEERIARLYLQMPDHLREMGHEWYFNAHQLMMHIAKEYADAHPDVDLSTERVAAIAAALSPQSSWGMNIRNVEMLLATGRAKVTPDHLEPALLILGGEDPREVLFDKRRSNPKVRSFFNNIINPATSTAVTIDRHAWGILFSDSKAIKRSGLRINKGEYPWAEARYRAVAEPLGILPHQLQAATWLAWKPEFAGDRVTVGDELAQPSLFDTDPEIAELAAQLGATALD